MGKGIDFIIAWLGEFTDAEIFTKETGLKYNHDFQIGKENLIISDNRINQNGNKLGSSRLDYRYDS